jgi:hypothetical protein
MFITTKEVVLTGKRSKNTTENLGMAERGSANVVKKSVSNSLLS